MPLFEREKKPKLSDFVVSDEELWVRSDKPMTKFDHFKQKIGVGSPYREAGAPKSPYEEARDTRHESRPKFNGKYTITRNGNFRFAPTQVVEQEKTYELDDAGHRIPKPDSPGYKVRVLEEDDPERYQVQRHDSVHRDWANAVLDDRIFV